MSASLIEESKDFTTGFLATSLVVIKNAECCCKHYMTKTTGRENVLNPLLDILSKKVLEKLMRLI